MEQIAENFEALWRTARILWIKYCGISDEYKMLRDRWLYLQGENKLMVLPYLRRKKDNEESNTFDLLDDHTNDLEKEFESIGFKRIELENLSSFNDKVEDLNTDELINRLWLIEEYFYDLSNFVGLLKSAFFQRTVSAEIQHVVSGIPHSPERTIGNELFYLAADNVAWRYCECLNIPYGKWDGFITFIPPIEEGLFYGAFYNPSPYLKLFHVSMSEEAKYFVGSYLALAHEFCHAIMRQSVISKTGDYYPKWFKLISTNIHRRTCAQLNTIKQDYCNYCPIYKALSSLSYMDEVLYEDFLADIMAYYIAGKNSLHEFIDAFFQRVSKPKLSLGFLLRVVSTYNYLKLIDENDNEIKTKIEKFIKAYEYYNLKTLREFYEGKKGISEEDYKCTLFLKCITEIGAVWADTINIFEKDVLYYLGEEPEEYTVLQHPGGKESFFKTIIKDKFRIEEEEYLKIIAALSKGIPVPEDDPRHILHCYYEAYKQSDGKNRPNYAATIYSLAFNNYSRKRIE